MSSLVIISQMMQGPAGCKAATMEKMTQTRQRRETTLLVQVLRISEETH